MRTKNVSHTADYGADAVATVTLGGARSTVDVLMLKDDELVGAFCIYRQEVRPFSDKQIELVQNFGPIGNEKPRPSTALFRSLNRFRGGTRWRPATPRRLFVALRGDHGRLGGLLLLRRRCLQRVAAAGVANYDRRVFVSGGGVGGVIVAGENGRSASDSQSGEKDGRLHGWPLKWLDEQAV
jgi:hypothetical protein